jgi:MerR family copper efflux transcriptional regulator
VNIGQAASASGVSAKMIRYCEAIGVLPAAARRESGYRDYGEHDVHRLRFVRRARDLGFPIERIRSLPALWSDRSISNAEVRAIATAQTAELGMQAQQLDAMIATLRHLVESCRGRPRAPCPILEELGGRTRRAGGAPVRPAA